MFSLRVVSHQEEARQVWELLSPKSNIYEDWDFRNAFYKYSNYPLRFYVGEAEGRMVGVLPLQENTDRGYLEFFGGSFMEDNHVLVRPGYEEYIPEFYGAINQPARLEDIVADNERLLLEFLENKFIIDLRGLRNIDDYLAKTFSAKTRSKLRKKVRDLQALQPVITENRLEDIDALIELNRSNFGADSSFNHPHRARIYHDLAAGKFESVIMCAQIKGKKECVSFAIRYGKTFVSLNAGTNKTDYENLGSCMLLKRIEKAIQLGCETYDAGVGELGWKELWHLDKVPEYKFSHD